MQIGHPAQALSEAIGAALFQDLSPIEYQAWTPSMKKEGITKDEAPTKERRPRHEEVRVFMFPETWGSTALGYGGMGGAAMTPAYTVVVACQKTQEACIYWGGSVLGVKLNLTLIDHAEAYKLMLESLDSSGVKRGIGWKDPWDKR